MFGKKKSVLGIKRKGRTKEECDRDYGHHATQLGHKMRIVYQLQEEIEQHTQKLIDINQEAMALPPEPPVTPNLATPPATEQQTA